MKRRDGDLQDILIRHKCGKIRCDQAIEQINALFASVNLKNTRSKQQ